MTTIYCGDFEYSDTLLVSGSGIAVLMAAAALVSATGLLYGAKWAQVVAVILSFPASTGFPAGLLNQDFHFALTR